MAKKFLYDSVGLNSATLTDGTISGTAFTSSDSLTNESYLNDENIINATTDWAGNDGCLIDLGSTKTVTGFGAYFTSAAESTSFILYEGLSTTSLTLTGSASVTGSSAGWIITDVSSLSSRYFFIKTNSVTTPVSEIMLGTMYTFGQSPELGGVEGKIHGVDVVESYGGYEYANKRHGGKKIWDLSFNNISSTMKTSLTTLRDTIDGDHRKFIYYDGSSSHYVRASQDSFNFKETAYQVYNTSVKLRQQIG